MGAAAVLAAGALAIGCSDDGGDTIIGGGTFTTDNFPGDQVAQGNVGDDGKAFTNQGQSIEQGSQVYWNVSNGQAIYLFHTRTTNNSNVLMYAAYFNGSQWSQPVQISGLLGGNHEDLDSDVLGHKVLWLNTAGHPVPEVAARNGDAIILWTRADLDPNDPTNVDDEDTNTRLWMTYFDVSAAGAASTGTVVRGFDTAGISVDENNTYTDPSTGPLDVDDPNVSVFGFVSDSLRCAHEFTAGFDDVDSGESTSLVSIVYQKGGGSGTTPTGERYFAKPILGDALDNDLAGLLGTQVELDPAEGALTTGDDVDPNDNGFITVSNQFLFWQSDSDQTEIEVPVTVTPFDEDGADQTAAFNLGNDSINTNGQSDTTAQPRAANIYEADHNLDSMYVITTQTGFRADNTPAAGDNEALGDTDLVVMQIDLDATSLSRELIQIDRFDDLGFVSAFPTQAGRDVSDVQTRINRPGTFITILFRQANTDTQNIDVDTTANLNELLNVAVVQTRRAGAGFDRTLAESVFDDDTGVANVQPLEVPALVSSGDTDDTDPDQNDVTNVRFQEELVGGQADSQADDVSCDLGCAIQSNANRVNWTYTQNRNTTAGNADSDIEDLLVNGVIVTLGDTDATTADLPTVALVSPTARVIVDSRDTEYAQEFDAQAYDAGDVTRDVNNEPDGDSGKVIVVYLRNDNNPTSGPTDTAGAFAEDRLFAWDDTDVTMLSTDDDREFGQVQEFFGGRTVPVNEDFLNTPHFAGSTLHLYWSEAIRTSSAERLATRSYNKGAINDAATDNDDMGDRFTPDASTGSDPEDPVYIDKITEGDLFDTNLSGFGEDGIVVLRNGSTVGVYFAEDEHVYYQETSSDANGYSTENGVSDPQLVDNDSQFGDRVLAWTVEHRPECNALPKSMVFFVRETVAATGSLGQGTAFRAYVRTHN